jgi:hypothetical protein
MVKLHFSKRFHTAMLQGKVVDSETGEVVSPMVSKDFFRRKTKNLRMRGKHLRVKKGLEWKIYGYACYLVGMYGARFLPKNRNERTMTLYLRKKGVCAKYKRYYVIDPRIVSDGLLEMDDCPDKFLPEQPISSLIKEYDEITEQRSERCSEGDKSGTLTGIYGESTKASGGAV